MSADGSVETITEEDPGQGVMYVIDDVLYSQYFMEDGAEAEDNGEEQAELRAQKKQLEVKQVRVDSHDNPPLP